MEMYISIEDCIFESGGIIFGDYVRQYVCLIPVRKYMNILISTDGYERLLCNSIVIDTGYKKHFGLSDIQLVKLLVEGCESVLYINVYHCSTIATAITSTHDISKTSLNFLRFPFEHDTLTLSKGRRIGVLPILLKTVKIAKAGAVSKVVNRITSSLKKNRLCILDAVVEDIYHAHKQGYILMESINDVKKPSNENECCFCLERGATLESNCCKTLYHSSCYLNILMKTNSCPVCTVKFSSSRNLKNTYISIN